MKNVNKDDPIFSFKKPDLELPDVLVWKRPGADQFLEECQKVNMLFFKNYFF